MAVSVVKKDEAEKGDREFQGPQEGGGGSFKAQTKKVMSEHIPGGGKEGDHADIWWKRTPGEGQQMQTLWTSLGQACTGSSSHVQP